jgi:RimJ/RimL family protein N-acetyltransferase
MEPGEEIYTGLATAYESDRLIYRAIENNEADKAFIINMYNDPSAAAMTTRFPLKPSDGSDMYDLALRWSKSQLLYVLGCLKSDGTTVGWLALFDPSERSQVYQHRNASVAVAVVGELRGQGYGREMIDWALDWGFRRANLHRVALTVLSHNSRAVRLYRRMGFVEEGRERDTTFFDRRWFDTVHFGMLEGEWMRLRGLKEEEDKAEGTRKGKE